MSEKSTIFKQHLFKKNNMIFFKFSLENLLIVLYKLIKVKSGGGSGWWGGGVWGGGQGGCERNVGGRGEVGYGGCEPRIEGIVQCTKRYCTILRK